MRRVVSAMIVVGILACLGIALRVDLSAAPVGVGPLAHARALVASALDTTSRVSVLRALPRRVLLAQSTGGSTSSGPTVQTDKADYHPGETVIVTGAGWQPGAQVSLTFHEVLDQPFHPDAVLYTSADGNGTIDTSRPNTPGDDYQLELHDVGVSYVLTAQGQIPSLEIGTAQATFTDNIGVDFKQCANKNPTLGACDWINSILNSGKSAMYEGMSTLQRFILTAVPPSISGGNYRVQFHMDSFKAAAHAYDFVTTWDDAIDATNQIAPPGVTQPVPLYPVILKSSNNAAALVACGPAIPDTGQPPTTKDICIALRDTASAVFPNKEVNTADLTSIGPVIGDDVQSRLDDYQFRYQGAGGHKAIRVYTDQAIDNVLFVFNGYDAQGNSQWQLTFHATTTQPTAIMLEFGAHIAVGTDPLSPSASDNVGYGAGRGAASISGSPFHVSVDLFDNGLADSSDNVSLGSQDNQLANDILVAPSTPTFATTPTTAGGTGVLNGVVPIGTVVHDHATVNTGSAINLIPAGSTFTFKRFNNGTCSGTPVFSEDVAVSPTGQQTGSADSSDFTALAPGTYSFLVDFNSGNESVVLSRDGVIPADCEVFTVADASIQITPATAVNAVGTNHTLTITVNSVAANIAAGGGTATASITSGPGSFVGGVNTCTYTGGSTTASCTVVITSATTGTTVVSATSAIPIASDGSITRTTDSTGSNSGPASKSWVDANIQITPASATNAVGTNHTLTITVNTVNSTITAGGGTATASISSGPGSFVGSPSCTYTGGAGSASCTVVITSATTGTTVVSATSLIPINGDGSVSRTTNGTAGSSGPASKSWADANIQITPATATNAVGTNHTLTITVNTVNSTITAGGGTATASISSGPGSFVGSPSCTYTGGAASASCTVVITSATTGTTVVSATSSIPINGDGSVSRTTNGTAGNSSPASKSWVDANIQITPATATNAVGTNHTLTITVNALNGTITAGGGTATASITSGPGSFVGPVSCSYPGGGASGNCTVVITSAAIGTTVVSATSSIPLAGDGSVSRTTNGTAGNSSPASKNWVDAAIAITPATATNAVGTNHTLTITVTSAGGNLTSGTATASISSGPGSFVGSPICSYTGGSTTASCNVVITSAVTGTTVVSATSNIVVGGVTLTRSTNGTTTVSGLVNSGPASKSWADATIAITPATATNAVGTNHTLTITVNSAGANIDAGGGTVTASITSGPGSFVPAGGNTCTYTGGSSTASCTVVITSAATGTTVVSATSAIPIGGSSVTRTTNGTAGNSGPASKAWVDARIAITPATATNAAGTNHTLTITVTSVGANLGNGTATASITSGPGSFVGGVNTCIYTGGGLTASCTVVITSAAVGTTVVSATSNIPVGSVTISRTTNGTTTPSGLVNSGPASKSWVDAAIAITPAAATNPIGTNHTLTITVTSAGGNLTSGTATASISSGPGGFIGSPTCSYTGGGTTASCTVVITSSVAGTTVISATSNIVVAGVTLTRTTNGTTTSSGLVNSSPAQKNWFDTHVQIIKNVNGAAPTASDSAFQFQLWTGLSAIQAGTLLETKTTTPGTNNVLTFTTSLVPGAPYQMCELVVLGYTPDFNGFGSFNPGGNNPGYLCFNFTANATAALLTITVNNIHQTGTALTIGYWKNWASCASSNGRGQDPSLDRILQQFEPTGFIVGILVLHDTDPNPDVATDCAAVRNLLDKTAINGGKKLASDPLFNMAAQYVAYKLNIQSGSTVCAGLGEAAQALLAAHNFNGLTHTALTAEQAAYANTLNGLLDTYNNNNGCGVLPTPPNPL